MRRALFMTVAIASLLPLPAQASNQVEVGMSAGVGYESNIFRTGIEEVPDVVWLIGPSIKLSHVRPRLDASIDYRPVAEIFQTESDANGVNQVLAFRTSYRWSPRTELTLSDSFGYVRQLRRLQVPEEPDELETGLTRTTQNRAAFSLRHTLTPRSSLSLTGSHLFRKTDLEGDIAINTASTSGSYTYALTPSDVVGLGATYIYTTFEDRVSDFIVTRDRYSHSLNAFAVWARTWNRKWRTSLRAGPAWISFNGEQDRTFFLLDLGPPPRIIPITQTFSLDSTTLTYFANCQITRSWGRASATLNYQRTASAQSVTGVDSTVDSLFLNALWDPDPNWNITARLGFSRRESANLAANDPTNSLTPVIDQWTATANARRRLSERLSLNLRFRYLKQKGRGENARSRDTFDNYQINFGFRYNFRPWRS